MSLYVFIFIASIFLLLLSGKWLVWALTKIARYLELREFVVAFIIMAFAASIPNLFVGITASLHGIPELSFGDIVGGNLIDLTIAVALAALIARGLPAGSRMVQNSAVFTMVVAILPLLLILDGVLGRGDGLILIIVFFFYIVWLFSKKERFTKVYDGTKRPPVKGFKIFIKSLAVVVVGLVLLLIAAEGIVRSATFFSEALQLSIPLVGILIVGFGNAIPEVYFAIVAARKAHNWMVLGDLMGSVIVAASLVLGIIALINPIVIDDFSPFALARFFLIIAAIFFLFFVRTEKKITSREALFLLSLYIVFLASEILTK